MHLYAICVDCLEGVHKIVCIKCKSRWDGSWHQLGTMYTYDILAASPCCQVGTLISNKTNNWVRGADRVDGITTVTPQWNGMFYCLLAHCFGFSFLVWIRCDFLIHLFPPTAGICFQWKESSHKPAVTATLDACVVCGCCVTDLLLLLLLARVFVFTQAVLLLQHSSCPPSVYVGSALL